MRLFRTAIVIAGLVLLAGLPAFAGTLKLKKGASMECVQMDRDGNTIFFDCEDVLQSFEVNEIESFNGEPMNSMAAGPSPSSVSSSPQPSSPEAVPAGPLAQLDPSTYTEEKMIAYYNANREKFRTPASIWLKGIQCSGEGDSSVQEARNDPASASWDDMGWYKNEDAMGDHRLRDLFGDNADTLFNMGAGQVSDVMRGPGGMSYVFMVAERKDPYIPPYDEISGKVKFAMLNEDAETLKKT